MDGESPYDVLGLDASCASEEDVRKAYKRLALKHHPDKNPDDPTAHDKFQRITTAYTALTAPETPPGTAHETQSFNVNINDLFEHLFSGGGFGGLHRAHPDHGAEDTHKADVHATLPISLREIRYGGLKQCEFNAMDRCAQCHGTGARDPAHDILTCPTCGGKGTIAACLVPGFIAHMPCPGCNGRGHAIQRPCPRCKGTCVESAVRTLNVQFPPCLQNGHQTRLHGRGNYHAASHKYADLYIKFQWNLPADCTRVDLATGDVHMRVAIDFRDLLCGFDKTLPLYRPDDDRETKANHDSVVLQTDAYVNPNAVHRVPRGGVPRSTDAIDKKDDKKNDDLLGDLLGDLVVTWRVLFPSELPPHALKFQDVLKKIFKR